MPEDYVTDLPASNFPDGSDLAAQNDPRRRSVFFKGLHAGLVAGCLALLFATFLPLLHPYWPLADVAEHFALQILMAAAILGALALALRRWRWLSIIGGVAFIQVWTIHPYWPAPTAMAAPVAGETPLKVVSLNVWVHNQNLPAVVDYLRGVNADVVGLVEVRDRMLPELAALNELYPYRLECVTAVEVCQELLLSKYPFTASGKGRIGGELPVLVWGEIRPMPNAPPVTVAVTHLAWPFKKIRPANAPTLDPKHPSLPKGLPRLAQTEQALSLTGALDRLSGNLVLIGDFNMAPWSRTQQYLRRATGLDNKGDLVPSWPSWAPAFLRLPIDHVMVRGTPQLLSLAAGPDVGSDHRPVEAMISLISQ